MEFSMDLNNIVTRNRTNKIINPFSSIQQCAEEKGLKIISHYKKVNDIIIDNWLNMFPMNSFDLVNINITFNDKLFNLNVWNRLKFGTLFKIINYKVNNRNNLTLLEKDKSINALERIRAGSFTVIEIELEDV
jgi:hypothetical protein